MLSRDTVRGATAVLLRYLTRGQLDEVLREFRKVDGSADWSEFVRKMENVAKEK
jgi:hypothetical protein